MAAAAVAACFTKFSRRIWLDDAIVFWRFVYTRFTFRFLACKRDIERENSGSGDRRAVRGRVCVRVKERKGI